MPAPPTIIGIAGASGAGKSSLANELHDQLLRNRTSADIAILHEDAYYRRQDDLSLDERIKTNYDHPAAFEHNLMTHHLEELISGRSVDVPVYDYAVHNRSEQTVTLEPSRILIVEGILLLHDAALRDQLDLKVFVDVPLDICLSRRILRDSQERGRDISSVLNQYHRTVRPMFFEFVEPSKDHADLIVPGGGANKKAIEVLHGHLDRVLIG
jgi:uridine kinase